MIDTGILSTDGKVIITPDTYGAQSYSLTTEEIIHKAEVLVNNPAFDLRLREFINENAFGRPFIDGFVRDMYPKLNDANIEAFKETVSRQYSFISMQLEADPAKVKQAAGPEPMDIEGLSDPSNSAAKAKLVEQLRGHFAGEASESIRERVTIHEQVTTELTPEEKGKLFNQLSFEIRKPLVNTEIETLILRNKEGVEISYEEKLKLFKTQTTEAAKYTFSAISHDSNGAETEVLIGENEKANLISHFVTELNSPASHNTIRALQIEDQTGKILTQEEKVEFFKDPRNLRKIAELKVSKTEDVVISQEEKMARAAKGIESYNKEHPAAQLPGNTPAAKEETATTKEGTYSLPPQLEKLAQMLSLYTDDASRGGSELTLVEKGKILLEAAEIVKGSAAEGMIGSDKGNFIDRAGDLDALKLPYVDEATGKVNTITVPVTNAKKVQQR